MNHNRWYNSLKALSKGIITGNLAFEWCDEVLDTVTSEDEADCVRVALQIIEKLNMRESFEVIKGLMGYYELSEEDKTHIKLLVESYHSSGVEFFEYYNK